MPISTNKAIREIIGVAIPLLVWLTPIAGLPPQGQRGFALVVFAILYWTLEPIPQAWTSVLVLIFVPLLGVADSTHGFVRVCHRCLWVGLCQSPARRRGPSERAG